ncbi:hypothetical protein DRW41_08315 [Neobacillus piezotolerans]|uniref:TraB/GumN family protein n=1 Tax=Neobacillus piezotolerans TaxID=2259171 RepID=A0A3D8GTM6_9BACI|nr:DUF5694 domain-containing protein [Neobacillus piezotolerans]RDU37813.1 hypothetical protein DRW41_08315 [Neobacillus piezotolerans]
MEQSKPTVLVLGSFHMSEHEELFSKKRQAEIEDVAAKLIEFQPTKIAVEMTAEKNGLLNRQYQEFMAGQFSLELNEIDQIGFRIASRLRHDQLYAVDWMGKSRMGYGEVDQWGKENQPELHKEIYDGIFLPELSSEKSVLEYYRELNDPVWLAKVHKMYLNMARIGEFNNYVGMNWLSWWYERNLIIFSNLTRLMSTDSERILFIVGCSHSSIITKFLEESGMCEIAEPLRYLSYRYLE